MSEREVNKLVAALIGAPENASRDVAQRSAEQKAKETDGPHLVMFAGFFGPTVELAEKTWRVLYIDLQLAEWLVFQENEIVASDAVEDDNVPFDHKRDVLWVRVDATVGRGDASQSLEAQFLTGDFTRAGDFDAPLTGGTLGAATGVFCQARTPSCCRNRSRPQAYP